MRRVTGIPRNMGRRDMFDTSASEFVGGPTWGGEETG